MQRNWDYWKNTFKKLLWNSLFYTFEQPFYLFIRLMYIKKIYKAIFIKPDQEPDLH